MSLKRKDLVPYVSVACTRVVSGAAPSLKSVLRAIKDLVDAAPENVRRTELQTFATSRSDVLQATAFVYEERRAPRWMNSRGFDPTGDLVDIVNHLVAVARSDKYYAIYSSDTSLGRRIVNRLGRPDAGTLAKLHRFDADQLQGAFLRGEARTLWMSGLHRRSAFKADSKVLSGLDLRAALDPLGDQSYRFTAARATVNLGGDNGVSDSVVGVSPTRSRVWAGPSRSWDEFLGRVGQLLDLIIAAEPEATPLPVVAQLADEDVVASGPYEVSAIDPILLSAGTHDDDESRQLAEKWAGNASFEIAEDAESTEFKVSVSVDEDELGDIELALERTPGGGYKLSAEVSDPTAADPPDDLVEAVEVLSRPGWATIRFASGHTYQDGRLYSVRFRDQRFRDIRWLEFNPGGREYNVKKEKPTPLDNPNRFLPEKIGDTNDPSLFTWTLEHYLSTEGLDSVGWLVCDDGSGEIADFIHIDDTPGAEVLRLIHVKGAGSAAKGRKVSASSFEVVVGQAIKNIRYLDNSSIAVGLTRASEKLGRATWHRGVQQADRSGVIAVAQVLGTNIRTEVVVLQPHLTKPAHERASEFLDQTTVNAEGHRLRQLDALLLEARAACSDLGATFEVWADGAPFNPAD